MRASDAKLSKALREAGINDLATAAERGDFNEFFGIYDFPELTLAEVLRKLDTPAALAVRARLIDGEFDAGRDESEEWAHSADGQAAMRDLINSGKR